MDKKIFFLPLLILFISNLAFSQAGVSVNNGKLFFSALPGEEEVIEVMLSNPNNTELVLQSFLLDWYRDSLGKKIYADEGSLMQSCASWLSIEPQNIVVPGNGNAIVRVKMSVPVDVKAEEGVKNTMLFVKQIKDASQDGKDKATLKSNLEIIFQIGIHIYYTHPLLAKKGMEIKKYAINPSSPDQQVVLALQNTGEVITEAFLQVEFTDKNTGAEYRVLEQALGANFMPGDLRYFFFPMPENMPDGEYTAMAIVDIGTDEELILGLKDFQFQNQ